MKLTCLLVLLAVFQSFAIDTAGQNTQISVDLKNTTMENVLQNIEEESDYYFLYSRSVIDLSRKVDFKVDGVNVEEALNQLFEGSNINYRFEGRQIVLTQITQATAQQQSISGVVKDAAGVALPGVTVVVKGTTNGTITDFDGKYALSAVPADAVLVFSFVGMQTLEMPVAGKTNISVTLEEQTIGIEEVVAVGYGVVKKADLTGSVASVKAEDIARTSSSNAMQAMQAQVPGLDIQQNSGEAGSKLNINLRGNRSISASNSPLILVDGIEYGSTLDINPSDIESMDVLKDAASTAIYGTKGANGVIIITTKRGKAGKTKISLNTYLSSNSATNVPKVMYGRKEVQRLIDKANYQADAASGNWGGSSLTVQDILTESLDDGTTEMDIYNDGSYTDWLDIILQNGLTQNYELGVSGGSEKTNFNLSLGTMFEEGLMKNDNLDRYNVKTVVDHKISDQFKVGMNTLLTYKSHDSRNSSVFGQSMKMTTITHPYLSDNTINENPNPRYAAHVNPLMDEIPGNYQRNIETTRIFSNAYLEVKPIADLVFKTTFAVDRSNSRDGLYQDYKSVARHQSPGTTYISSTWNTGTKYTWENTLTYNTDFNSDEHDLTVLLGHSMNQSVTESTSTFGDAGAEHYYQSAFYDLSKIGSPTTETTYIKQAILSYFSRVNYKFRDKYLLQASVRADGSSTLADGNKWGYFPSTAVAWRMSEEPFLQDVDVLDNLKLRASWGISGNAAVDPYQTLQALSSYPVYYYLGAKDVAGNIPDQLGNQDLKWETTNALNFGLDFGFMGNRVSGSIDFFTSRTSDLLLYRSAPASSVFPTVISNIGETKGHGIEIALNTSVVRSSDWNWDINWSYSSFTDEVSSLYEGVDKDINGTIAYIVGEPVSAYYDWEADGTWDVGEYDDYIADWQTRHTGETAGYISDYGTPGTIKVIDRNDDGVIDDSDKRIYNRSPKHIIGMNNSVSFKDFSLSVLLYARVGGYIAYDFNNQMNFESANWADLDYWTVDNTDAKFPNPGSASALYTNYSSSLLYEKANYVKVKDITLAYNLPKTLIGQVGLGSVKLYGSLKNFITFSSIDNYDPERGGSISFPLAKQVVFGANIEF
ncbi:TonB-dependent receptor [Mangrovibacterium marinum]|nr:TonB-dependent receptor [Mangrovibacterium marinum]